MHLSDEDRELIESYRAKGVHHAREVNRAHILCGLDRKVPEAQIMAVLGVGRTVIWRTRSAYLEGGVAYALHDVARPGKPRRYDTGVEAQIAALACSEPPTGAKRWTLELLEQTVRTQDGMGPISRETIRRLLKKLPQAVAQADVVRRQTDQGVSAANVRSARPLRPSASTEGTCRLSGREAQAIAQAFSHPLPIKPGTPIRMDYEYVRAGTCNLFVAVEPKGGRVI